QRESAAHEGRLIDFVDVILVVHQLVGSTTAGRRKDFRRESLTIIDLISESDPGKGNPNRGDHQQILDRLDRMLGSVGGMRRSAGKHWLKPVLKTIASSESGRHPKKTCEDRANRENDQ